MQVRVFQSIDMASGLKMIKKELGPDALILSTKTIRNGKLGLLSKPLLEITAAIDSDFQENEKLEESVQFTLASQKAKEVKSPQKKTRFTHVVNDSVDQYLDNGTKSPTEDVCFRECPTPEKDTLTSYDEKKINTSEESDSIQNEVNELKLLVKNLAGQISTLNTKQSDSLTADQTVPPKGKAKVLKSSIPCRATINHFMSLMTAQGINQTVARNIAGSMRPALNENDLSNNVLVNKLLKEKLQSLIKVAPPSFSNASNQQRIALVGATGVGKTTTLAKIAASYLQQHSNSIALITIDTYRIAAVEQLKVYGEIMNIPVDVVITPQQLGKALQRHKNKKLILIDTAGRSPRDSLSIGELTSFFMPNYNIEKHLVLSATTRENETIDTIKQFSKTNVGKTIFTKIDECTNLGGLLNVQLHNPSPISYITNGQRVPEDLLEISPHKIAGLIMSQDQGSKHE